MHPHSPEEQQRRKHLMLYHRYGPNEESDQPRNWWIPLGVIVLVVLAYLVAQ
jgi:hypothetical protein